MFRLVLLESDPARGDYFIPRLQERASDADSFPIKYKLKSRTAPHPAPHSLLTPNSFPPAQKTPPKPKNGIGGNFIFPADRITMRRSYLISANMKYQYP